MHTPTITRVIFASFFNLHLNSEIRSKKIYSQIYFKWGFFLGIKARIFHAFQDRLPLISF